MDGLPSLAAGVTEVSFDSKFGRKFRKTGVGIHFNAPIRTTLGVRGLESAFVGGAMESEEFVESVTEAFEGTLGSAHQSVRPSGVAAINIVLANNLLRNFGKTVENVADRPTQLAGGGVASSWRRLNIAVGYATKAQEGYCKKKLFHWCFGILEE